MSTHTHFLTLGRARLSAAPPSPDADHAVVEGACPNCRETPFKARGVPGSMHRGHDHYVAAAACVACDAVVGSLVVTVDTIFGIEEDEAVLNGRARVYGSGVRS